MESQKIQNNFVMKSGLMKNKQYWRQKIKSDLQRKNLKKQIFGDHYNLAAIRLNNNKKYFNEEVRIMQIERSNRLLLQKIKKISQRSKPRHIIERARTQVTQSQGFTLQRSKTEERIKKNSFSDAKKERNQSIETTLEKSRSKKNSFYFNLNKTQMKKQSNQNLTQNKNRKYLYKGKKIIEKVLFRFEIFIQKEIFTILSKTQISEQKIEIPEENYLLLLKTQLSNNPKNILNNLKLLQNNKLQLFFKDPSKIEIDLIEKVSMDLPIIQDLSLDITSGS